MEHCTHRHRPPPYMTMIKFDCFSTYKRTQSDGKVKIEIEIIDGIWKVYLLRFVVFDCVQIVFLNIKFQSSKSIRITICDSFFIYRSFSSFCVSFHLFCFSISMIYFSILRILQMAQHLFYC